MRTVVQRDEFARLLTSSIKAVQPRNTIPILSCVLLSMVDGVLTARSSDLDIDITNQMPAEGEAGAICVEAKLLSDIVRKASGSEISMALMDDRLVVKSGRSTFKLSTLPAGDFPTIGEPSYDAEFDIDLAALVSRVQFAMSSEETRYYLNGVLLHVVDGRLVAVATDGHRLARDSVESPAEFGNGIIVPAKTIGLLPKGVVTLAVSDTKIRITSGTAVMVSKLVDGTYPDYQRVIPSQNDKTMTFERDAMMQAADRVSVVSTDRGKGVKFSFGNGEIALSVRGEGEAEDAIAAECDDEMEVGFKPAYLRDILTVLPAGSVSIRLADPGSPALIKTDNAEHWSGVLMPMRVL